MTGNLRDAHIALEEYSTGGVTSNYFLDSGCTRCCYLINDIVYKVEDAYGSNAYEFSRAFEISEHLFKATAARFAIPAMRLFDIGTRTVLAAEYVAGTSTGECYERLHKIECTYHEVCIPPDVTRALLHVEYDTCYGNVIVNDDTYFLVDLG